MRPFALLLAPLALWCTSAIAGLDIVAFDRLTPVNPADAKAASAAADSHLVVLNVAYFPERFEGLKDGATYRFDKAFEFRAGSYSGYNRWRNELAKLAGNQPTPVPTNGKTELRYDATVWDQRSGPFWELIAFSDDVGVIGPVVCKRVYQDFLRFDSAAARHPDPNFRESYADWKKAFAMCANGGAIEFH